MNKTAKIRDFFSEVFENKKLMLGLAKNDFKSKYAGSFFGVFWGFALPLVTILLFWFVFQLGFKSPPVNDFPFILWFIPAFTAWNYFSETLMATTNTLYDYNFLVKKVKFPINILPPVKTLSGLFVHFFFIGFTFLMFALYGFPASLYNIQVIYYLVCLVVLNLGLAWLVSALAVFFSDLRNIIIVVTQIGFWMVPIFWNPNTMNPFVVTILKLNPMYYICTGYRDCFVDYKWFWEKPMDTLYVWILTLVLFILGIIVYKKMRPHFADVL